MISTIEEILLGDLVEVASGQVDPRQRPFSEMPHIGGDNIESHTGQLSGIKSAAALGLTSGKYLFSESDILYSKIRPNLNKVATPDFDGLCSADIYPLRPNADKIEKRYLLYVLRSKEFLAFAEQHSTRTNIPKINRTALLSYRIPLPPLPEQKRIADILDKADAIRRKRQEELDILSTLRSSTFLGLFGDPRMSRTDWPQVQLRDVTVLDAPMVDPREDDHIDLVHLGPDRIEKNTGRLLPALTTRQEGLISGKFLFDRRHVLYSKIRPYLRKVALPKFTGLCSADVYSIRPVEKMATREYLFSLLISEAFLAYTTSLPSRASIPKLNRTELAAYTFHLPPLELQEKYTDILCAHERHTETFGRATEASEHLFNALVQRAFKGDL